MAFPEVNLEIDEEGAYPNNRGLRATVIQIGVQIKSKNNISFVIRILQCHLLNIS